MEASAEIMDALGDSEVQVFQARLSDLESRCNACKKKSGHEYYIPLRDFTLSNLPRDYFDEDVVQLVRAIADLTVKISLAEVSSERPEFWPGTRVPYPFYELRGEKCKRSATGFIVDILEHNFKHETEQCYCHQCPDKNKEPCQYWWEITILTAGHVIFDNVEAKNTSCRLFYDEINSPSIKIREMIVDDLRNFDIKTDKRFIKYVTCDYETKPTIDRLKMNLEKIKYKSFKDPEKRVIIVSHPHGGPKQISIKNWCNVFSDGEFTKYTYNAPTCPGSSGAPVYMLGGTYTDLVHSGTFNDVNYSGYAKTEIKLSDEFHFQEQFNEGDVMRFHCREAACHGIYVGNGMIVHSVKVVSTETDTRSSNPLHYLFGPKCYFVTLDKIEDVNTGTHAENVILEAPMFSFFLHKRRNAEDVVTEALKNVGTHTSLNSLTFVKHCNFGWRTQYIAVAVVVFLYAWLLADTRCASLLSSMFEKNYYTILLINILILLFCIFLAYINQAPKQVNNRAKSLEPIRRLDEKSSSGLFESKSTQLDEDVEVLPDSKEEEAGTADDGKVNDNFKCFKEEIDVLHIVRQCLKNPGHTRYIPITSFSETDLPEDHRDYDVYQLIRATSDLTVRVVATHVSLQRIKHVPNTTLEYPFYNKRGHKLTRMGSGQITVFKYTDGHGSNYDVFTEVKRETQHKTCPCETCRHSDIPSNVWWEIFVHTAAHVVFDENEASHVTCTLFYDKDDTPLVTLDKLVIDSVDLERDVSVLRSVTCDAALGDRLHKMMKHYSAHWKKVCDKYRNISKLVYIVSHPHGCTKQVSLGQLIDNKKVREYNEEVDLTELTYTAATCPGCAGAAVHCIGLKHQHFHTGTLDSLFNCSRIGLCFN